MNTIGIIAEYNPFHNGHLYQIEEIKKRTNASYVVVIMSGDFVQRGTPAWTDKYLRTQMALEAGAGLVFELPVSYAVSSAEYFARAGVSLLDSLGFVDGICFGSETADLSLLQMVANFLSNPGKDYHQKMKQLLATGLSFPTARQQTLEQLLAKDLPEDTSFLQCPNNILAIEYLKALYFFHSPLRPFSLQRKGGGYHSTALDTNYTSATAIRKLSFLQRETFLEDVRHAIPEAALEVLKKNQNRFPLSEDSFSDILYYALIHQKLSLSADVDLSTELKQRIQNKLPDFTTYSQFVQELKTGQYTYSRIRRVLLRTILRLPPLKSDAPLPPSDHLDFHTLPYIPYVRLLGFRKECSHLLRTPSCIPVITKPADGSAIIDGFYHSTDKETPASYILTAQEMYQSDLRASQLYSHIQSSCLGCPTRNEYKQKPVIIKQSSSL